MPVICRLPQKSSGSTVLTGTAVESDVASGKTFYNTDSNTKLTGTASGGGMVIPVGTNCAPTGAITIPNGVTSIAQYAFYNNISITNVIMPNTITSCESKAFNSCSNLTNITLSTNLQTLTTEMFGHCSKLTSITIPNSVTSISVGVFSYCSKLTSITIPNSITTISSNTFYSCSLLNNIVIPNSVTTISSNAFSNCTGLTTISLPNSVTTIDTSVFSNCSNLEFITLASGFNCSIRILASTKYNRDTIMAMINAYANASGKTLTIGATNLAKLSTEDKAVASNKGLTLA